MEYSRCCFWRVSDYPTLGTQHNDVQSLREAWLDRGQEAVYLHIPSAHQHCARSGFWGPVIKGNACIDSGVWRVLKCTLSGESIDTLLMNFMML